MHQNKDKTRKKENMDGRHRQTGRDQALPHEAPESNPSQKTKQKGGKVKQRRQIQSQQQRRKGRTIHLAEERRAARKAKQRNKQVTKQL